MSVIAPTVWTVTEITQLIKTHLELDERFQNVWVSGEISNFKHHTSGHMYFTLKDENARIRAVMFAARNRSLGFRPEDGMRVICCGRIGVYERDGQYQLYVEQMQPDGIGALYVAFTQLKERLEREGLFDPARKRPLPPFPRRIGVVTSPTGAVIRDICTTLARRWPLAQVVLSPALVQGPDAAPSLVAALERLIQLPAWGYPPVDVIIIGRGGGSLEELWPFNEEAVARAVAACPIPVISAVGHETDVTICDFVADVRAATPTAAAELAAPHIQEMRQRLTDWGTRGRQALQYRVQEARKRLAVCENTVVLRHPVRLLEGRRQTVDALESALSRAMIQRIDIARRRWFGLSQRLSAVDIHVRLARARARVDQWQAAAQALAERRRLEASARLDMLIGQLESLNPLAVLRRGYSIVYRPDGVRVVSSRRDVRPGDPLLIQFQDGRVHARVTHGGEDTDGNPARDDGGEQIRLDL
ncbi:MAG: exodeoxyribonuclease VII large subunit [Thermoflavifilum sp.]|nr:exodeoxyribonuclease VII large subunit [Thermoflavifilum sp.]MCL6514019.1 exodeoxyribonuclease VII large subunit [Alicyclobacillus sp.]